MKKAAFPIAMLLGCVPACSDDSGQPDAGAGALCYSPTSNLSTAYQPGAVGCACNPATDRDVCVQGVALICTNGHWHAVEDGPCMPQFPGDAGPDRSSAGPDLSRDISSGGDAGDSAADSGGPCYSPTSNLSTAYQPGAVGCPCNPAVDQDVCVEGKGLMCMDGHWHAVIDGPCMPPPTYPKDAASEQIADLFDVSRDVSSGGDVSDGAADGGSCYGPTTDLSTAYQLGSVGCACDHAVEPDVCVRGIGLMCMNGRWKAVMDGPCMPSPPRDAANEQVDAVDAPIDSQVRTDAAGDGSPAGQVCGDSTCQPGELCVPGCIGICRCTAVPDSGTCPNGPCTCGALAGCRYVPPSYCSPTVPTGCTRTDAGTIQCTCA